MKSRIIISAFAALALAATGWDCLRSEAANPTENQRHQYPNILNISYTPNTDKKCTGWFTDCGSWMGFTLPQTDYWINGFCGPFSLDAFSRYWMAGSAATVRFAGDQSFFTPDSTIYYPGEAVMNAHSDMGAMSQRLIFADANSALLTVITDKGSELVFSGYDWNSNVELTASGSCVLANHPSGETVVITFTPEVQPVISDRNYEATVISDGAVNVMISFFVNQQEALSNIDNLHQLLSTPDNITREHGDRWQGYFDRVLRKDMPHQYDKIAIKALTTLISNWRSPRGGLLHEGIVPSHAVGYFVGFWAWDSWRFSAATAKFAPEIAKNNIRAMFDYQLPDGMVIDCIYTNPDENNARDSKPPLVSWAVDEIFKETNDTMFLSEIYPHLLSYYNWWYQKRDHDGNGICEFGSTDGTLEAAAWESGMDNAIRFDNAVMVNNGYKDAYSLNQESVDLNSYLALECRKLRKFAKILDLPFDAPDHTDKVSDYFFNDTTNFFHDRCLDDGKFIADMGCEAYTPLWTQVAKAAQLEKMLPLLKDPSKFSTYIPFPSVAADNPKYNPHGYWRGPIWLDQTYFAINGLRRYGYEELADEYTRQVFDRLEGLQDDAPIHENYDTHSGARLKAPNFSWSSSHLLMLYAEYGRPFQDPDGIN